MACASGSIFVVMVLILFMLILYATFERRETFALECAAAAGKGKNDANPAFYGSGSAGRSKWDQLIDPERMEIYQGISIPVKYTPTEQDISDPSMPSVDGESSSSKSMHMFSFNKCAPECCIDSPYSCDRGCVCITPKQYEFLDKRGANRNLNGCTLEDKAY